MHMKTIKKITEIILTLIACAALLMMVAEADTIGMQLACTFGSFGVLYICCRLLAKVNPDLFKEDKA